MSSPWRAATSLVPASARASSPGAGSEGRSSGATGVHPGRAQCRGARVAVLGPQLVPGRGDLVVHGQHGRHQVDGRGHRAAMADSVPFGLIPHDE